MISGSDFHTVQLQLQSSASAGRISTINSDKYLERFNTNSIGEIFEQSSFVTSNSSRLDNMKDNTYVVHDQNYNNLAFSMSTTIPTNKATLAPISLCGKNYNSDGFNNQRKNNWKTSRVIDNTSYNKDPNDSQPIVKEGNHYQFRYNNNGVNSNNCDNNINRSMFCNTVPLNHHNSTNGFNKTRYYTHNRRLRRYTNQSEDIFKRVFGLMERFKSKGEHFKISPILPVIGKTKTTHLDQAIWDIFIAKAQTQETYLMKIGLWQKLFIHITLEMVRNVRVSALTVRRRLSEVRLSSRRPAVGPLLTTAHRVQRLRFARNHADCTVEDWKRVLVSDKTRKLFDRYALFMVGSTMCGLATENSDIDMCLLLRSFTSEPRVDAVHFLELVRDSFINCDFVCSVDLIQAKVPILKFIGLDNGFAVDLNCNNAVGIRNTHLLNCYVQMDWRVRPLALMVKLWAQANTINDAKHMTISSYSLALMVIHYLQCGTTPPLLPCLHSLYPEKFKPDKEIHDIDIQENIPRYDSQNQQALGELLLGFLHYYACFNYETDAISVRLASRVSVEDCRYARSQKNDPHQWKYLCIEEPFDLTNTARSVYDLPTFRRIQRVFQESSSILWQTGDLNCILKAEENQR